MIKNILFLCFVVFFSLQSQAQSENLSIHFTNSLIELGEMKRGDIRDTAFIFTNTGLDTLQIDLVSGCECTTLDWPRLPIAPGEDARIDVSFDSTEKEESGEVEIDIIFKNIDPKIEAPYFRIVSYTYQFVE